MKRLSALNFLLYSVSALILLNNSCIHYKQKENIEIISGIIEENIGTQLNIPKDLRPYYLQSTKDRLSMVEPKYRIYTHINVSCGICIEAINDWMSIIPKLSLEETSLHIICSSNDNFELFQFLCESGKIKDYPYPFYFDFNDEYIRLNEYMDASEELRTVLTNNQDSILLFGNPLHSDNIRELYFKTLNEL